MHVRNFYWSPFYRLVHPHNARLQEGSTLPFSNENQHVSGVYGTLSLCKEPRKRHMATACKPCCTPIVIKLCRASALLDLQRKSISDCSALSAAAALTAYQSVAHSTVPHHHKIYRTFAILSLRL